MPTITVVYDDTGRIVRWRQPKTQSLNPDLDEITVQVDSVNDIEYLRVDTSGSEPTLVDDPDSPIQRYRNATALADKVDALFELETGEKP